jgi:hypothetical protein
MISYRNRGFKQTKHIKQGEVKIHADFESLADCICTTYMVRHINIRYEVFVLNNEQKARLEIIFEFTEEYNQFSSGLNNDSALKASDIANEFIKIVLNDRPRYAKYSINNVFAVFYSFQKIAKEEINALISDDEIRKLKEEVGNSDTWHVFRTADSLIWFLYTDEQVGAYTKNGNKKAITDWYFNLLKKYDEFDYIKREQFSVSLDSKENFDAKYESSWFYYFR